MPLVIQCPSCAKRYQVADTTAGKQVRCQQCGQTFTASSPAPAAAPAPPAGDPFAQRDPFVPGNSPNPLGVPAAPSYPANPLGTPAYPPAGGYAPTAANPAWGASADVSNPSGGPTDAGMRMAAGALLGLGVVIGGGSLALLVATGTIYLIVLGLVPMCFVLGIAGLISPNTLRAMGKYGGHLPGHYKLIGWGLMGLSLLLMGVLMALIFMSGFEPDRPGRPRRPRGERPRAVEFAMHSPFAPATEGVGS